MSNYETYKVFDVHNSKKPLSSTGVSLQQLGQALGGQVGNDAIHEWIHLGEDPDEYEDAEIIKKVNKVNKWLLDSGAVEEESVLIRYWW